MEIVNDGTIMTQTRDTIEKLVFHIGPAGNRTRNRRGGDTTKTLVNRGRQNDLLFLLQLGF